MSEILKVASKVLDIEAAAILKLKERLDTNFEKAVKLLLDTEGRVVFSGIGKSGHIAKKISSTLASTGTPSLYVHPAEASHGDMGIITKADVVVMISNGGNSVELNDMIAYVQRKNIPLIGMTSKPDSQLGSASQVILDISVDEEACPMGLAPTTSTTVSLALGDALAMATLSARGFKEKDYAEYHPGGSLGRKLLTRVRDVMHTGESLPLVRPHDVLREVITRMTGKDVRGVAGIVGDNNELLGIVTDGDIRRSLEKAESPLDVEVRSLMSSKPKTIHPEEMAQKALFLMEQFQIQTLFVVEENDSRIQPIGIIHLQDLLRAKIK
ncbi:MAG: SIS domain-containing protein [Bdellovibrionales bacterium]